MSKFAADQESDAGVEIEVPRALRTLNLMRWVSGKLKFLPRLKRGFSPEFKYEAVKIVVETSRPIVDVANELGIDEGTLDDWVSAYRRFDEEPLTVKEPPLALEDPPLSRGERARLREIKRENGELKMELEFLKKAAAYRAGQAARQARDE
jgi:transposase-like protein